MNQWTREFLLTAGAAIGLVAVFLYSPSHRDGDDVSLVVSAAAQRAFLVDRLVGTKLQWNALDPKGDEASHEYVLLRILYVESCVDCLSDIGSWNYLTSNPKNSVWGVVLTVGAPSIDLTKSIRALRNTRVVGVGHQDILSNLGTLLPDTYMLLSKDGTIIMVDGRMIRSSCGWDFPSQVGGLLGLSSVDLIRVALPSSESADDVSVPHPGGG